MNNLNLKIEQQLRSENVNFVHFVDISMLDIQQNRGLPYAILIGIAINPQFIKMVYDSPNYVHILNDEYAQTENQVGLIADKLADRLIKNGYKALSQSDRGLIADNSFDFTTKTSVLPHKTIAIFSGTGYIGKNNLFITTEYGAAQCLGSVLTNAPLAVMKHEILLPKCNSCNICQDICPPKVLKGKCWNTKVPRDEMVNVNECITCLKCLVHCPKTQAYMKRNISIW
ncbi:MULTISPECIES: 4Fe-4S dicluster domain-containing protein [Bacteroidales]|uniref:4Fe-4S dicluster domain-containing protein n=1 Tax=Bacteroidales TaxID=171549 RepID=UPI002A814847|nr:epoxyqueuosine reductase [Butyricimonas paravirosa]